ncbi:MAG: CPBP family glutamic-type intramembrane protease [Streptococcaceae bacterium]|jgi:membrane protease YdiL (CAAX protease family)|nr:CPBP family glutamic-type intramembrane protease [Streptococcaceae bacterium]MCH4176691.1 CPBP family glutamic-type intramembrane protease [Streptococcaceae bacterium]
MKKILYLLLYFFIIKILPANGTNLFFFEGNYKWILYLFFAVLGIFLFWKELYDDSCQLAYKKIVSKSVAPAIAILFFYGLFSLVLVHSVDFYSYTNIFSNIISAIFFVPLAEELAYRYCLILIPINNIYRIILLIISIFLFTFGHIASVDYSLILLIPFLFMSVVFSYTYIKQKNIWYSILSHAFYNSFVILFSIIIN